MAKRGKNQEAEKRGSNEDQGAPDEENEEEDEEEEETEGDDQSISGSEISDELYATKFYEIMEMHADPDIPIYSPTDLEAAMTQIQANLESATMGVLRHACGQLRVQYMQMFQRVTKYEKKFMIERELRWRKCLLAAIKKERQELHEKLEKEKGDFEKEKAEWDKQREEWEKEKSSRKEKEEAAIPESTPLQLHTVKTEETGDDRMEAEGEKKAESEQKEGDMEIEEEKEGQSKDKNEDGPKGKEDPVFKEDGTMAD